MLHYILAIVALGGTLALLCMAIALLVAVMAKPGQLKSMRVEFNRRNKGVAMEWQKPAPPPPLEQSDARPRLVRDEESA